MVGVACARRPLRTLCDRLYRHGWNCLHTPVADVDGGLDRLKIEGKDALAARLDHTTLAMVRVVCRACLPDAGRWRGAMGPRRATLTCIVCHANSNVVKSSLGSNEMWVLSSVMFLLYIPLVCFPNKATAGCNDTTPEINWSDPSVVKGDGIFQRGSENYPFDTYTVAARDPSDTHSICFRYLIKNTLPSSGTNAQSLKPIKSFRWNDINLPFVDIDTSLDWGKSDFTNYSDLQISTSNVGAFENSPATTRTILTTEETEAAKSTGVRPLGQYDVKDHFPTAASALDKAHLPSTPVIPVPNETAKGLKPIVNKINTKGLHATITSSSHPFSGNSNLLETEIDFNGLDSKEVQLFIPTLPDKQNRNAAYLKNADDLLSYIDLVRTDGEKVNSKIFDKGGFLNKTTAKNADNEHPNDTDPAFFIVKYPITIQTKSDHLCVIVYGLSPYPINADEFYCKK